MSRQSGFSLIELSVVLVILGLLTGGILAGKNLISTSQLHSVLAEYDQWQTAVNVFQQKYSAVPGDLTDATEYWGRADDGSFSGQCADPDTDVGTGTQTCNGNGDGYVGTWGGNPEPYYEAFRFWQHLANAGLIPGVYTGVTGTGGPAHHVNGLNVPASKFSGGGWSVEEVRNYGGDGLFYAIDYGNYFEFGASATNSCHEGALLTPTQAWNLDEKLDDGRPGKGFMIAGGWNECTLSVSDSDLDADYDLANDNPACFLNFIKAF